MSAGDLKGQAASLTREALLLLEQAGEELAAAHLRNVLALIEPGGTDRHRSGTMRGDAFAHAIAAMTSIVEEVVREHGIPRTELIAGAIEAYSEDIAAQDLSAALLLDRWAEIIRRHEEAPPVKGRRDN